RAGMSGLTIMLMTGAEERAVAAIEKLTKQKFEIRTLEVAQRGRGERSDRRERPARRDAAEHRPDRSYASSAQPVDDFFSKPYEPGTSSAAPLPPSPAQPLPSAA